MTDLPSLLLSYGIKLKQVGNEYSCLCFAHDDHNPSMSVYVNGNGKHVAHCFSCGYHGDVIDAYKYLSGEDDHKAALQALEGNISTGRPYATIESDNRKLAPRPERTMLKPDASTPMPNMGWLKSKSGMPWGEPAEVFPFLEQGIPIMYEARWNLTDTETGEMKKECRVFSWGRRGSAPPKWECSHHLPPRPLYGLDELSSKPAAQVIVCEGARKAAAAQKLLPSFPCIGWAGGANGWDRSDWSPITDRNVILWPDADEPGRTCMAEIAQHLIAQGCTCYILDTSEQPEAWDAADAVTEGWDTQRTLAWAKAHKGEAVQAEEKKTPEEMPETELPPLDDDMPDFDALPHTVVNTEGAFTDEAGLQWSTPSDVFDEIHAPQINPDMMPECIRDWMIDTAGVKGVDPSMLALSSIVAAAGCLHDAIKVQPERTNPGWRESARLWGAIVGSSGIKKSPAIGAAVSRLKKIQLELSHKAAEMLDEVKARELAYELANKEYIKALSKNDPAAPEKKPFRREMPEITRLFFEDITIEKLSEELKCSPRGAFILRDELAGWFGSHAQYRSSGSDAPAWLDFYEGGPKYIDRIGRGSIFVPNWGGCILGGIQPSAIQKIIDGLPEDGLLQRFMVVNARPGREGNEEPYDKAANDRYHDMLQRIFDTEPGDNPILLSIEANDVRRHITRHAQTLINAKLVSTGLCSHLSKYEGLCARLMLTFHAIDCASRNIHPQSCHISGQTAHMVQRFMLEFLLPHAIAFYINIAGQSNIGHAVKKVAELCLLTDGEISNREIMQNWLGWRHYKPFEQETVINALVDHGWIQPHPRARKSIKGFPTRFLINPRLHEFHAARREEEIERRKIASDMINLVRDGGA